MITTFRRVERLEAAAGQVTACRTCAGQWIGVAFSEPRPADYAPDPHGRPAPLPPNCPACGRTMPKLYVLPSRATWDGMVRP